MAGTLINPILKGKFTFKYEPEIKNPINKRAKLVKYNQETYNQKYITDNRSFRHSLIVTIISIIKYHNNISFLHKAH